jgi:hypothetical protein
MAIFYGYVSLPEGRRNAIHEPSIRHPKMDEVGLSPIFNLKLRQLEGDVDPDRHVWVKNSP